MSSKADIPRFELILSQRSEQHLLWKKPWPSFSLSIEGEKILAPSFVRWIINDVRAINEFRLKPTKFSDFWVDIVAQIWYSVKKTIYSSEESSSSKRAGAFFNPFVMVYLPCLGFSVINITAPHPLFKKSFEKSPRPSYESWLLHRVQYKYQGYLPKQYQVTATPVSSHELQSCRRRRPGHWLEITMLRYLVPRLPQVNIN